MMNKTSAFICVIIILLCAPMSAQQSRCFSLDSVRIDVCGCSLDSIGEIKVYFLSENDLPVTPSDTIEWTSHPQCYVQINAGGYRQSYRWPQEFSSIIYQLLPKGIGGEIGGVPQFYTLLDRYISLYGSQEDIRYVDVSNCTFGYALRNWLHYYKNKEYGYRFVQGGNMEMERLLGGGCSLTAPSDAHRRAITLWQQASYGKTGSYALYEIADTDEAFVVESCFGSFARYDIVIKHEHKWVFLQTQHSFPDLLVELRKYFSGSGYVAVVRMLCLIDMYYQESQ